MPSRFLDMLFAYKPNSKISMRQTILDKDKNASSFKKLKLHGNEITYVDGLFSYSALLMAPLVRDCVLAVLSECVDQLFVLNSLFAKEGADNSEYIKEYETIDERYKSANKEYGLLRIKSGYTDFHKLQKDIRLTISIIHETCVELFEQGTYSCLLYFLRSLEKMECDNRMLVEEEAKNQKLLKETTAQYIYETDNKNVGFDKMNQIINNLKFEIEDLLFNGKANIDFVKKWEASRKEQNTITCRNNENVNKFTIENMKHKMEVEEQCHKSFCDFIDQNKNECMEQIEYWMKLYEDEMEQKDAELVKLRSNIETYLESHVKLQETYDMRCAQIADWLEYKRIKKEKKILEKLWIQAATKIQAWWRGVMFRKKIGPYAKKKGKGKGKDKGKNKKGKKK